MGSHLVAFQLLHSNYKLYDYYSKWFQTLQGLIAGFFHYNKEYILHLYMGLYSKKTGVIPLLEHCLCQK